MTAGLIALLAAGGLSGYNLMEEKMADMKSAKTAAELSVHIPSNKATDLTVKNEILSDSADPTEVKTMQVDGNEYIGILSIPSLDLTLPIMKDWNYTLLKQSPCRYEGYVKDNSLIIAGHNYQKHFGQLYKLKNGDSITFTDITGKIYRYKVFKVETLAGTAIEEMKSGAWDLTLFTCTPGGVNRVTVRCKRV